MTRIARCSIAAALGLALIVPAAVTAAEPSPVAAPASVVEWQTHLAHMRSMSDGVLAQHVKDCVAMHGSVAGLLGPNGMMVEMMGATGR